MIKAEEGYIGDSFSALVGTLKFELTGGLFDELSYLILVDNLGKRRFDCLGLSLGAEYLLRSLDHRCIQPKMLGGFFHCGLHGFLLFDCIYIIHRVATYQGEVA